jgi:hypothetical protein
MDVDDYLDLVRGEGLTEKRRRKWLEQRKIAPMPPVLDPVPEDLNSQEGLEVVELIFLSETRIAFKTKNGHSGIGELKHNQSLKINGHIGVTNNVNVSVPFERIKDAKSNF